MYSLADSIRTYDLVRHQFEKATEYLEQCIRQAIDVELPHLEALLPDGYGLNGYEIIHAQGEESRPNVKLRPPTFTDSEHNRTITLSTQFDSSRLADIDTLLGSEYARISEKYGINMLSLVSAPTQS